MKILISLSAGTRTNKLIFFRQTAQSILDKVKGKTVIAFDTETTGLSVHLPWVQITEIASIAYDVDSGKELGRYHVKVKLGKEALAEIERQKRNTKIDPETGKVIDRGALEGPKGLSILDLLKMSEYEDANTNYVELQEMFEGWVNFVNSHPNVILVAQNAGFDLGQVMAPLSKLKLKKPKFVEVLDTITLARTWVYPILKAAAACGDERSAEMLKQFDVATPKGTIQQFRLGTLGKVFDVPADHWHSGLSDTVQTMGIFLKMLELLRTAIKNGHEKSDVFKAWHARMSKKAFSYGKRPAFEHTIDSQTRKGIKERGVPRV